MNNAAIMWKRLATWLASPLGERVVEDDLKQMQEILPGLFGFRIVQFGYHHDIDYLDSSRIVNKIYLRLGRCSRNGKANSVITHCEILPIVNDSIDVTVLPQILQFSHDPHGLLRELDRILIDDGYVVITGINLLSLWGIWHLLFCWSDNMPWAGRLISVRRVKYWLSLLNFDIEYTAYYLYAPPFRNPNWLRKFRPLERLGKFCWPFLGGLYVIVGKKRVAPLNPIKMTWQKKQQVLGSGVVEPTIRNSFNSDD